MVNKEKLLLLATVYMLLPGAMPDAVANASNGNKTKTKKPSAVKNIELSNTGSMKKIDK